MNSRKVFFLIGAWIWATAALAQQLAFRQYNATHGLGSSSINHIFQDSQGFVWLATQGGGISRFDGHEFVTYTKKDGLVSNDATYVTEDRQGNIWIGTAAGASLFDGKKFYTYDGKGGLSSDVVYCIYADRVNTIWFATRDGGLRRKKGSTIEEIKTNEGKSLGGVFTIAEDSQQNIWLGYDRGIARYEPTKPSALTIYAAMGTAVFSSFAARDGSIWFGTASGKVIKVNASGSTENIALPDSLANDFIGGISEDNDGNLWFATEHGLLKYSAGKFQLLDDKNGLSVNIVQTVMCDAEDNVWAGTLIGGLNILTDESFVHFTTTDGLLPRNINCLVTSENNTAFIGTNKGVYLYDQKSTPLFRPAKLPASVQQSAIAALLLDSKKQLWVATGEGVQVFANAASSPKLLRSITEVNQRPIISPQRLSEDHQGNVWLATYGSGVFMFNDKNSAEYSTKTGFASDNILTVFIDSQGNTWIGTADEGLHYFDGDKMNQITLPDQAVWSIAEGSDHTLYFGTGESGIYKYHVPSRQLRPLTNHEDLAYTSSLSWDERQQCLWAANEKNLHQICLKNKAVEHIHTYATAKGFTSSGNNPNGLLTDAAGHTWICTINGLWQHQPGKNKTEKYVPNIRFTSIQLQQQNVDWSAYADSVDRYNIPYQLQLPFDKNTLTFAVRCLTQQDVRYSFLLEGQDGAQWTTPDRSNGITLAQLAPGSYVLKAKASIIDGEISDYTVSFAFTILPPWWKTAWFYTLLLILLFGMVGLIIYFRERILQERNRKLSAIITERTTHIEQQKKVVEQMLSEKEVLLKEIHHRVKNNLQTISSMMHLQSTSLKSPEAKRAIADSQDRVRAIALLHNKLYQNGNPGTIEFNGFVQELATQIEQLHSDQPKQRITISVAIETIYLPVDTAITIGLLLNELLTNSYKHAFHRQPTGQIFITLYHNKQAATRNEYILTYEDNGPGLPNKLLDEPADTLGLRLINILTKQLMGRLSYSNTNGSKYNITFPLPDAINENP